MFFGGSPVIPIPSLRIPMIFLWFSYDIPNIGPDVFWGESCHSYPVTEDSNDFPVIFLWYSKYRTRCFLRGVLSFLSRHWGFQWFSCDFPMIFQKKKQMFFGGSPVIPIPSLRIPMIFLWFSYDIPNIGPDVFWGESCHSYPVTEDSNDFPVIFLWYSKYRTRCFLGGVLSFLSRHWGFQWFSCDFPMIFQI